jgi:hexosaminidase
MGPFFFEPTLNHMKSNIKPISSIILLTLIALFAYGCNKPSVPSESGEPTHGIIPLPKQLDFSGEKLTIDKDFILMKNSQFKIASLEAESMLVNTVSSFRISETTPSGGKSIQFIINPELKNEAYQLSVNTDGIQIQAGTDAGAFAAVQSLKQYLWNSTAGQKNNSLEIQCLKIVDEPKYEWRGFHLDVSRHMFTKAYILKVIDWLAYYKFNKFHLHLTDDQGWRIESKKFPLLNELGSWRTFDSNDSICMRKAKTNPDFTIDPRFIKVQNGKTVYGGYYTREDLAEIVAYAKNRFIEIIPEIDMPGHMSAAIRAYPQLSCTGSAGWGTEFSYPICPCNNEVIDFTFQIWDEILDIFPSNYVHIGADEVEKDTWKTSQACQDFMKANNLTNVKEIQSFFVRKLQEHLEEKGKTVIAWDDVTEDKMDSKLKIMYWRDWVKDSPAKAAANGNQIIFTRWDLFYLSSQYSDEVLKNQLEFDLSKEYPAEIIQKITGFQGCVWTEEIPSEAVLESQIFPRLQALSEVCWSSGTNLYSFNIRMKPHMKFLMY